MNARAIAVAFALLLVNVAGAAPKFSMAYTPVACLKAGELPLLQLNVEGKGELRAYFRRINSSDWCSVEGTNDGPLSRVVLPKFENGDDIEYFFVLLDGRRVVARSPRIFRARVSDDCQTASSMGAGYAVDNKLISGAPPLGSPDRPENQ
jgi:hypothetical protein